MYTDKTLRCAKCKKLTPLSDIRAAKNAIDWICTECYQGEHTKKALPIRPSWINREVEAVPSQKTSIDHPVDQYPQKKTFKCTRCSYSFLVGGENPPLKCPYCGRDGTLTKDVTSSSLLHEIEEEESRFKKF